MSGEPGLTDKLENTQIRVLRILKIVTHWVGKTQWRSINNYIFFLHFIIWESEKYTEFRFLRVQRDCIALFHPMGIDFTVEASTLNFLPLFFFLFSIILWLRVHMFLYCAFVSTKSNYFSHDWVEQNLICNDSMGSGGRRCQLFSTG